MPWHKAILLWALSVGWELKKVGVCVQEDLTEEVGHPESPSASEKGSTSVAISANRPDQAVEQQILARVAFVCNPPPSKLPENPLVRCPA